MNNRFKSILGLVVLVSLSWGGFADAIRDYDNIPSTLPQNLSLSGMYSDFYNKVIAPDLIPYVLNTSNWSDGTRKKHWIWLPPGTQITPNDTIGWAFPTGAVIAQNIYIEEVPGVPSSDIVIETRIMVKGASFWNSISYEWFLNQSDAVLVDKNFGADKIIRRFSEGNQIHTRWRYPAVGECTQCHPSDLGPIGINGPNMNTPSPLDGTKNQLQDLAERGVLSHNLLASNPAFHKWARLDDPEASLEVKARSYLAINCSNCHIDEATAAGAQSFIYWQADKPMNYQDSASKSEEYPRIVFSGNPSKSYILKRMTERFTFANWDAVPMPALNTYKVDSLGLTILSDWICEIGGQAAGCNPIVYTEPNSVEQEEYIDDPEYWETETKTAALYPHAFPEAVQGLSAFIINRTLHINGLQQKNAYVQLMDLSGKAIGIRHLDANHYHIDMRLNSGVYILKAGTRVLKFNFMP